MGSKVNIFSHLLFLIKIIAVNVTETVIKILQANAVTQAVLGWLTISSCFKLSVVYCTSAKNNENWSAVNTAYCNKEKGIDLLEHIIS